MWSKADRNVELGKLMWADFGRCRRFGRSFSEGEICCLPTINCLYNHKSLRIKYKSIFFLLVYNHQFIRRVLGVE